MRARLDVVNALLATALLVYGLLVMRKISKSMDRTDRDYQSTMDTLRGMLPGDEAP
jgi:hypothetical protein